MVTARIDTARAVLTFALDGLETAIAVASGDSGIDADDRNSQVLLSVIERQERAISALATMVQILADEVASLDRVLDSRTGHMA